MTIIRATARLSPVSGLDEDAAINVWHFADSTGTLTLDTATGIALFVATFYQNATLAALWSPAVMRGVGLVHRVDVASVSTLSAGPDDDVVSKVVHSGSFAISTEPTSPVALPSEVAVAMSFAGDLEGFAEETGVTRPRSRRRGRLFLGPWCSSASATATGNRASVSAACRDAILDAYALTITSINSIATNPKHVVYSVTNGNTVQIETVSVDDAFDTVRSRGQAPTVRETRAVVQT